MAFVPMPADLSKVKTKIMFNLTSRQLICFTLGGAIAAPAYWFSRPYLGNTLSMLLLMVIVAPFIFIATYKIDGLTGEKFIKQYYNFRHKKPLIRVYKNSNMYDFLDEIVHKEEEVQKEYHNKKNKTKKRKFFKK
ncbi:MULTISPECIES: PrgI family protein [unclassified Aerococcus]|uniref:PrgI family protein n=1 Tax=unclassified Aerococcus TaxID=2618060 RepID=UPI0008A459D5|nr:MULTISPECIES: PrgI family protein [unclassified Aerococcus]MDK6679198.1 PrgI family protein [Aerococcus sp. UMB8608]MDK6685960.1 PrgI family protein [Aerococcus sp. UMB8623]MDK6940765.1 PrgI family protein [Aerococcus sp. UMB8487]OFK21385.1 hypothetical protein HMPREF2829_03720 [Aerococcus sp. HMSC072A12]OFR32581.1 hypothetical protein HMPREF2892_08185 [Aerococcus sp. HMSC061A03]